MRGLRDRAAWLWATERRRELAWYAFVLAAVLAFELCVLAGAWPFP